jgi:DNA helicase HerA-like ATPase
MESLQPIIIGQADAPVPLLPRMANRHGLIAGATGTGKTITLQGLTEEFSLLGVPVFLADVKGDLTGLSQTGKEHPKIQERVDAMGLSDFAFRGFSVTLWDVFGKQGHPVRTTISDMGPLLLSKLLGLNDTQQGVLSLVFRVADDNGWLLLDIKDLRSILQFVAENAADFRTLYGNISAASVGAIQRRLLSLEDQGGDKLFGEPALNLDDLMQTDDQGNGMINILAADQLMNSPLLYGTFLLWLMAELFEQLPEVGDREKPRLVLFFDEAHLLFDDTPEILLDKIEQVVRLIRSKGVGVYFVTQNPTDIPDSVLGQLGNRIQHALRAYTPKDQKAVRSAAQTFRPNPKLDTGRVITELGVGEALVSTLDAKGSPRVVQRTLVRPPRSRIGPVTRQQRGQLIAGSLLAGVYDKPVDRKSAYEILAERAQQQSEQQQAEDVSKAQERELAKASRGRGGRQRQSVMEAFFKSAARAVGSQVGRQILRGVLGSIMGGRR